MDPRQRFGGPSPLPTPTITSTWCDKAVESTVRQQWSKPCQPHSQQIFSTMGYHDAVSRADDDNTSSGEEDGNDNLKVCSYTQAITATRLVLARNLRDIEERDAAGNTPLIKACELGRIEIVKLLVEQGGAQLHATSGSTGMHAWHYAAAGGHTDVLQMLQSLMPEESTRSRCAASGQNALHIAIQNGHLDTATWLLEHVVLDKESAVSAFGTDNAVHGGSAEAEEPRLANDDQQDDTATPSAAVLESTMEMERTADSKAAAAVAAFICVADEQNKSPFHHLSEYTARHSTAHDDQTTPSAAAQLALLMIERIEANVNALQEMAKADGNKNKRAATMPSAAKVILQLLALRDKQGMTAATSAQDARFVEVLTDTVVSAKERLSAEHAEQLVIREDQQRVASKAKKQQWEEEDKAVKDLLQTSLLLHAHAGSGCTPLMQVLKNHDTDAHLVNWWLQRLLTEATAKCTEELKDSVADPSPSEERQQSALTTLGAQGAVDDSHSPGLVSPLIPTDRQHTFNPQEAAAVTTSPSPVVTRQVASLLEDYLFTTDHFNKQNVFHIAASCERTVPKTEMENCGAPSAIRDEAQSRAAIILKALIDFRREHVVRTLYPDEINANDEAEALEALRVASAATAALEGPGATQQNPTDDDASSISAFLPFFMPLEDMETRMRFYIKPYSTVDIVQNTPAHLAAMAKHAAPLNVLHQHLLSCIPQAPHMPADQTSIIMQSYAVRSVSILEQLYSQLQVKNGGGYWELALAASCNDHQTALESGNVILKMDATYREVVFGTKIVLEKELAILAAEQTAAKIEAGTVLGGDPTPSTGGGTSNLISGAGSGTTSLEATTTTGTSPSPVLGATVMGHRNPGIEIIAASRPSTTVPSSDGKGDTARSTLRGAIGVAAVIDDQGSPRSLGANSSPFASTRNLLLNRSHANIGGTIAQFDSSFCSATQIFSTSMKRSFFSTPSESASASIGHAMFHRYPDDQQPGNHPAPSGQDLDMSFGRSKVFGESPQQFFVEALSYVHSALRGTSVFHIACDHEAVESLSALLSLWCLSQEEVSAEQDSSINSVDGKATVNISSSVKTTNNAALLVPEVRRPSVQSASGEGHVPEMTMSKSQERLSVTGGDLSSSQKLGSSQKSAATPKSGTASPTPTDGTGGRSSTPSPTADQHAPLPRPVPKHPLLVPDYNGNTPLMAAAKVMNYELAQVLLTCCGDDELSIQQVLTGAINRVGLTLVDLVAGAAPKHATPQAAAYCTATPTINTADDTVDNPFASYNDTMPPTGSIPLTLQHKREAFGRLLFDVVDVRLQRLKIMREKALAEQLAAEQARLDEEARKLAELLKVEAIATNPITRTIPYAQLKMPGGLDETKININRRVDYLSDQEFEVVFGVPRDTYAHWPDAKKTKQKQAVHLGKD